MKSTEPPFESFGSDARVVIVFAEELFTILVRRKGFVFKNVAVKVIELQSMDKRLVPLDGIPLEGVTAECEPGEMVLNEVTDGELTDESGILVDNGEIIRWFIAVDATGANASRSARRRGRIRNVLYRDIRVTGDRMPESIFIGYDADHRVTGVVVDGLYLNGRRLDGAREANVRCGNEFADPVTFATRQEPRSVTSPDGRTTASVGVGERLNDLTWTGNDIGLVPPRVFDSPARDWPGPLWTTAVYSLDGDRYALLASISEFLGIRVDPQGH